MAFTYRFSNILIGSRQNFSMANNFMRKIYSIEEDQASKKNDYSDGPNKLEDNSSLNASQKNFKIDV